MSESVEAETRPQSRQRPGGACEECRRRKLRCDRRQPQCGMCAASGSECHITTNRAPRGPKRGYLKAMQARIGKLTYDVKRFVLANTTCNGSVTAAALEGSMLKQQNGADGINMPVQETWTESLLQGQHTNSTWDFPIAETEAFLHDLGSINTIACLPESSGESNFSSADTTTSTSPLPVLEIGAEEPFISDLDSSLGPLDYPQGLFATKLSSLMQAELYVRRRHQTSVGMSCTRISRAMN